MNAQCSRVVFLDAGSLPRELVFDAQLIDYQPFAATADAHTAARIADAEVVITNKVRLTAEHLSQACRLSLVCVAAAGTDNVDLAYAQAHGIAVRNVPDYGCDSVAEHAIAMLFALRRELLSYTAAACDGRWKKSPHFCWTGPRIRDIGGSVFGVVGRGRIGESVARLARGLGMQVLFARMPGRACAADELPLDELLRTADALSLHVPLTDETRGLVSQRTLALMKPDAVLINTGRGALVDAQALADALRAGRLGGAAIDVLDIEPPPDNHPLLASDIPHLLLTPHVAWASDGAQARLAERLVSEVQAHLATQLNDPVERTALVVGR